MDKNESEFTAIRESTHPNLKKVEIKLIRQYVQLNEQDILIKTIIRENQYLKQQIEMNSKHP